MAAISSSSPAVFDAFTALPSLQVDHAVLEKLRDLEPRIHAIFTKTLETQEHEKIRAGQRFSINIDRVISEKGVSCILTCWDRKDRSKEYAYRILQSDIEQLKKENLSDEDADKILKKVIDRWFEVKFWIMSADGWNPEEGDVCQMIEEEGREKLIKCLPRSTLIKISRTEDEVKSQKSQMSIPLHYRLVRDCFSHGEISNLPRGKTYLLLGKRQTLAALQAEAFQKIGLPPASSKDSRSCVIS